MPQAKATLTTKDSRGRDGAPRTGGGPGKRKTRDLKEWTVMIFFASDGEHAPSVVSQLKSIKDAGFHPDANIVAWFDPQGVVTPTHVFDINLFNKLKAGGRSQVGPLDGDIFVRNLALDRLWGKDHVAEFRGDDGIERVRDRIAKKFLNERLSMAYGNSSEARAEFDPPALPAGLATESAPALALKEFLNFCCTEYPARHYVLLILGHGLAVDNDLFLFDEFVAPAPAATGARPGARQQEERSAGGRAESNGGANSDVSSPAPPKQALLLSELREILATFAGAIEKKGVLELVGFHSCSMSSLEIAYELRKYAKYMLASQGPIFVGSWAYRQILMRLFRNLNSPKLTRYDFEDAERLIMELKKKKGSAFKSLGGLLSPEKLEARCRQAAEQTPDEKLLDDLAKDLDELLDDPQMLDGEPFQQQELSEARSRIEIEQAEQRKDNGDVRRFKRLLLADACPGLIARHAQMDAESMFGKIVDYCVYNSLDFQMAGYSSDYALCDLSKVGKLEGALRGLTKALVAGLDDRTARDLILVAHWEAQSYWHENYTDLYDFCRCLYLGCQHLMSREAARASRATTTLKNIKRACYVMMKALSNKSPSGDAVPGETRGGKKGDPDLEGLKLDPDYGNAIVRSEFTGPAHQYSHGLSVFFPWSEPIANEMWNKHYETFELNRDMKKQGDSWKDFLKRYFDATKRPTRADERREMGQSPRKFTFEQDIIDELAIVPVTGFGQVVQAGGSDMLSTGGTIKPGGSSSLDGVRLKPGGSSSMGDGCGCASIKNYPTTTRPHSGKGASATEKKEADRPGRARPRRVGVSAKG